MPLALLASLALTTISLGSGCVTLYEPMGVLQRPTVVAPATSTFNETRVQVRCLSSDDLPTGDAEKVCLLVSQSLRAQGAETETIVPRQLDELPASQAFDGAGADLSIEITSTTEHHYDYPLLAAVSVITLTAVPSVAEETYRQDIVVRGRNQTVLAQETLRARFVTYVGVVVWAANYVADWFLRDDDNDLSGDLGFKDFSKDFYGHVAQLTFNARVRSDLLGLTARARPLPAVLTAPATAAPTTAAPTTAAPTTAAPTSAAPPPSLPATPATAPPPTSSSNGVLGPIGEPPARLGTP